MARRNWTLIAKLAGFLVAVGLAIHGCSGGGDTTPASVGAGQGAAATAGLAIVMNLANPQPPARVVTPDVAFFQVSLLSGQAPDWTTVVEQVFPRDTATNQQTLSLSGLQPGVYTLRIAYLGSQHQILYLYQVEVTLTAGGTLQIISPDYLTAWDFSTVLTTTAPAPFRLMYIPEDGGFTTTVPITGPGAFTSTLAPGVYGVVSPYTVQVNLGPQPQATPMPPSFTAGPSITQTLFIQGPGPVPAGVGIVPATGHEVTHTATSPCPQGLGTYVFINNTAGPVQVSPHSTDPNFDVAVPGATSDPNGMYTVPSNGCLNLVPSYNCSQPVTGAVTGAVECFVLGESMTQTVSAPVRVNVLSPPPTRQ